MTVVDTNDLTEEIKRNARDEALRSLLAQVPQTSDYRAYLHLCRERRVIAAAPSPSPRRIALLSGATTDYLEAPLKLELESLGINAVIHRGEYNTFVHEMLVPDSRTVAFQPGVAVVIPTPFNITEWPATGDTEGRVEELVDLVCDHFLGLCLSLHTRTKADIVLGNFHTLPDRITGNLGCRLPWDRNSYIRRINTALSTRAPAYVHIFDIDGLSAFYGVSNWLDTRFWYHAKQPVSFGCVVPFVRNLGALIAAIYGKTAKCIVLDLDNTLWGGVVGDDGVAGLKIGEGGAEGEAFKAFGEYLLQLKNRGLLLAVCSKNELENARAPFEQHPDMVLRLDDFVSFKASWSPKPQALEQIARELNIGLDALVFVDDNPAERDLVRQTLPQVRVVDMTDDPSDYPRLLDRSGWLEMARFTEEDRTKVEQYQQNAKRNEMAATNIDYDSFLDSLNQQAVVSDFEPLYLDRITQLINKTNQFNLTTRRMTRSEVEDACVREDILTFSVRLADRLGDSGLISAMICQRNGDILNVDLWAMSCRVFKRGVEDLLTNRLFEAAKALGVERVRGTYIPTAKNKIVSQLYAELGFDHESRDAGGATVWSLEVAHFVPIPVHISVKENLA